MTDRPEPLTDLAGLFSGHRELFSTRPSFRMEYSFDFGRGAWFGPADRYSN